MKKCWKCKTEKKLTDFYKNRCQVDGHENMCKKCKTSYHKKKGYDNWEYKTTKWNGRGDYGVYKITNNSTNEVYIGKGWLKEREYDHFYQLMRDRQFLQRWQVQEFLLQRHFVKPSVSAILFHSVAHLKC